MLKVENTIAMTSNIGVECEEEGVRSSGMLKDVHMVIMVTMRERRRTLL